MITKAYSRGFSKLTYLYNKNCNRLCAAQPSRSQPLTTPTITQNWSLTTLSSQKPPRSYKDRACLSFPDQRSEGILWWSLTFSFLMPYLLAIKLCWLTACDGDVGWFQCCFLIFFLLFYVVNLICFFFITFPFKSIFLYRLFLIFFNVYIIQSFFVISNYTFFLHYFIRSYN